MHALRTPAIVAMSTPLEKLNSRMTACLCSAVSSRSFERPASPLTRMPARQTSTPARTIAPAVDRATPSSSPRKRGGMSVPNAAQ